MDSKINVRHIESACPGSHQLKDNLAYISPEEVCKGDGENGARTLIVIDGFVYDVTEFSKRHPGGSMPFKTFAGKCCSWQFHKIHSLETLQRHEDLRIGWTGDVSNPYEKPAPKVVKPLWFRHWH